MKLGRLFLQRRGCTGCAPGSAGHHAAPRRSRAARVDRDAHGALTWAMTCSTHSASTLGRTHTNPRNCGKWETCVSVNSCHLPDRELNLTTVIKVLGGWGGQGVAWDSVRV